MGVDFGPKLLAERLELESEHGKRVMGVLLFQDLAVVPLLVLIPALGASGEDLIQVLGLAQPFRLGGAGPKGPAQQRIQIHHCGPLREPHQANGQQQHQPGPVNQQGTQIQQAPQAPSQGHGSTG
jgi:hypothetical protein